MERFMHVKEYSLHHKVLHHLKDFATRTRSCNYDILVKMRNEGFKFLYHALYNQYHINQSQTTGSERYNKRRRADTISILIQQLTESSTEEHLSVVNLFFLKYL